ncbi:hypothetical protein [Salinispora vitiensis]|uniref:hypothetical protein n=1 Tax=Salinispora vitiensis TaxID=999544 RepID=UPI0003636082|nr:hypothetical protein [Salinispora vitiensis]
MTDRGTVGRGGLPPTVPGGIGHGLTGVVDAGTFLARLVRLDRGALVRLRPVSGSERTALWARLPWGVLVVHTVAGGSPGDATVSAGELLAELTAGGSALPVRRDAQWRWPLPPPASRRVETLPAAELRRGAEAAADALRDAAGRGVEGRAAGERVLRDALLDHVPVVVTPDDVPTTPVEVPQRLVQGLVRMGFVGAPEAPGGVVQVRTVGSWVGLVGPYGAVWLQRVTDLTVRPILGQQSG